MFTLKTILVSRALRWGLGMLATLVAAILVYGCAGRKMLQREIDSTPRHPQTGVVKGAEALTLDPPTSATLSAAPTRACLLLHGFVGARSDFSDLGERLAKEGFHVRMIREAGHGTTPPDFAAQTPQTIYAHVEEEYRALRAQYDEVYVVGFSMGGSLGTLLASREPVDRLVLAAPYYGVTYMWYYILPVEAWNRMIGWAVPYVVKSSGFIKVNRPDDKDKIYTYKTVPTRGVSTLVALGKEAREPATLQAVKCPVLMLISQGDEAASPRQARRAFGLLGSADKTFIDIPKRNNHHIFWDWDHDQTKQQIVDFLKQPAEEKH